MQELILGELGKTHHLLITNSVENINFPKLKFRAQCIAYFTDLVGLSIGTYKLEYFNLAGRHEDDLINIIETYINPKYFDNKSKIYIPEYDSWKIIFAILAEKQISLEYKEILQLCLAQILPLKHLGRFPDLPSDLQNTLLGIFKKEYPIASTWKAPTRLFSKQKELAYVQLEKLKNDSSREDYLAIIAAVKTISRPSLREPHVHAFYRKWQILLNINFHNLALSSTIEWAKKLEQKIHQQNFENSNLASFVKEFFNYCQYPILNKMISHYLQSSTIEQEMNFLRKYVLIHFARQVYQQNFDSSWLPNEDSSSLRYLLETVDLDTAPGYIFRTKINVQTILIHLSRGANPDQNEIKKFNHWLIILTLLENDQLNENETNILKYCIAQLIPEIKKYIEYDTKDLVEKFHSQFLQELHDPKWDDKGGVFMRDLPRNIATLRLLKRDENLSKHKQHLLDIDPCFTRSPALDRFYSKWQVLLGESTEAILNQNPTENHATENLLLTAFDVLLKFKQAYEESESAGDSRSMMRTFLNRAVENLLNTIYNDYKNAIDVITTHGNAIPKSDSTDLIFIPTNYFSVKAKLLLCLPYLAKHQELFDKDYHFNNDADQVKIDKVHQNYFLWVYMLETADKVIKQINLYINNPELPISGQNNNVTMVSNQNDDTVPSALAFQTNL